MLTKGNHYRRRDRSGTVNRRTRAAIEVETQRCRSQWYEGVMFPGRQFDGTGNVANYLLEDLRNPSRPSCYIFGCSLPAPESHPSATGSRVQCFDRRYHKIYLIPTRSLFLYTRVLGAADESLYNCALSGISYPDGIVWS